MSSSNAALDSLTLYGVSFPGRLLLGTARYPSPKVLEDSVRAARPAMLTVSLRRQAAGHNEIGGQAFWDLLAQLDIPFLPNTAGCHTPEEVFTTAMMAREVFGTEWIKLELIGDDYTLQPDTLNMVGVAERLLRDALTADLSYGPAHNNLGVLRLKRGDLSEAANEFEWARKLIPEHPDRRFSRAPTLEVHRELSLPRFRGQVDDVLHVRIWRAIAHVIGLMLSERCVPPMGVGEAADPLRDRTLRGIRVGVSLAVEQLEAERAVLLGRHRADHITQPHQAPASRGRARRRGRRRVPSGGGRTSRAFPREVCGRFFVECRAPSGSGCSRDGDVTDPPARRRPVRPRALLLELGVSERRRRLLKVLRAVSMERSSMRRPRNFRRGMRCRATA
jgi:hypothetical protein